MKYIAFLAGLLLLASPALAAVTVVTAPSSLLTSALMTTSSSAQIPLFEFALNQDAGETLSSVAVLVNSATAVSSDLASVSVYKDGGNGVFDAADLLAGTNATVNVGSNTVITTAANNTLTGGKFFVTLATSGTFGAGDSFTVTMPANAITTSANSPTTSAVTTAAVSLDNVAPTLSSAVATNSGGTNAKEAGDSVVLTFSEATNKPVINAANINTVLALNNGHSWLDGASAIGTVSWNAAGTVLTVTLSGGNSLPTVAVADTVTVGGNVIKDLANNNASGAIAITGTFGVPDTTGPVLTTAAAQNSGGTAAKEAGDSILLTFGEATNKPTINAANVNTVLALNNSHSWLDGAGVLGTAVWNAAGTTLTITLTAGTSIPTVAVGDTVTVGGSVIKDAANNNATGSVVIGGAFDGTVVTPPTPPPPPTSEGKCGNGLTNGKIYKVGDSPTVYLAAACRLKPFRGAAVFHARGLKFQNIITLSAMPENSQTNDPALPAEGTLVQGSDATVWFVTKHDKKKGFTSENAFKRLGFSFKQVKKIADSDLAMINSDSPIDDDDNHPDGSLVKCGNSAAIFQVIGNSKFPFTNADSFQSKGHSFDHVVNVDCGRFAYVTGAPVSE